MVRNFQACSDSWAEWELIKDIQKKKKLNKKHFEKAVQNNGDGSTFWKKIVEIIRHKVKDVK